MGVLAAALMLIAAPPALANGEGVRVVALGDSLTAGYGLTQGEGFVPTLERWLHAHGAPEATVIDMGVSGDTTAGGRARLDWALADGADAVIVALGGNDLLRGLPPEETRANLDAILSELDERGIPALLAGLPAPKNYGPDYEAAFNALYPDLAEKHDAILVENFLAGVADGGRADARLMQEDGIHPNAEGVERMVEAIGPKVRDLVERARAEAGEAG